MNSKKGLPTRRRGFTIIELMVAIAIAAVLGSVLIGMVLQSQSLANSAKLKSQATSKAEQLLEQTRTFKAKTNGWQNLVSVSGNANSPRCYTDTTFTSDQELQPSPSCPDWVDPVDPTVDIFASDVALKKTPDGNGIIVTATVFYLDRGTQTKVTSATVLTNFL